MPELDVQVRELVDACAFPVTIDEVKGRAVIAGARHAPPRARRRGVLVAVTAAALVAVGVGVLLFVTQSESPTRSRITTPASTRSAGVTPDCMDTATDHSGCPRTRAEAQTVLGIRLSTPSVVADGWTLQESTLVDYSPHFNGEANATDVLAYRQVWAPAGTDLANDPTPPYLAIRQRAALPGETDGGCANNFVHTRLQDGAVACGDIPPIRGTYGTNGPLIYGGELWWTARGVTYAVVDRGLTNEEVLRVLDSLR
jgi:hypothetical protein